MDELGHVNNVVYLSWIQDVARAHWFAVSTPEESAVQAWVAVRHEIELQEARRGRRPAGGADLDRGRLAAVRKGQLEELGGIIANRPALAEPCNLEQIIEVIERYARRPRNVGV